MISIISDLVWAESGTTCYHHESTIPVSIKPHLLYRSQECPSGRTSSIKNTAKSFIVSKSPFQQVDFIIQRLACLSVSQVGRLMVKNDGYLSRHE